MGLTNFNWSVAWTHTHTRTHTHTHIHTEEERDVIGCMRDLATGMVSILDTWNPGPQGSRTPNQLDGIQDSLACGYVTEVVNGRISCTYVGENL